jgi:hypothetical protein
VWPPWSFNPSTGLLYIPSTAGSMYGFQATPGFVASSTDIGPTGRGAMNMGTGPARPAGGAGRGAAGAGALAPGLDPNAGRPAAPTPQPSRLLVYALDGKATLPPPPVALEAAAGGPAGGGGGRGDAAAGPLAPLYPRWSRLFR